MALGRSGGHNPWADDEPAVRDPRRRSSRQTTLVVGAGIAIAVGVLGGAGATYLALQDDEPRRPVETTSSQTSASSSTSTSTSAAPALTPSTNVAGAELTHLPVDRVGDVRAEESQTPITLTIVNHSPAPVRLQWIDFEGKSVEYNQVAPGQTVEQPTFATHPWLVSDAAGSPLVLVIAGDNSGTVTAA